MEFLRIPNWLHYCNHNGRVTFFCKTAYPTDHLMLARTTFEIKKIALFLKRTFTV